ncbi:MAG: pilus assembly protein PilP [Deltaproteobacteria bacterium]|nr:pilus assembly protein PilP [Deltaproteobacteria bacterium]
MRWLGLMLIVLLVGCGEKVQSTGRRGQKKTRPKAGGGTPQNSASSGGRRTHHRKGTKWKSLPEVSEQDFIENTEANRDPFRDFLKPQATILPAESFEDTRVVLLEQYELSELALSGIGGRRPRMAMFRTPGGRTTNVSKGVRISKSKALIVDIAEDHVILQVPQLTAGQRPTFVERILWVDPSRKDVEISAQPLKPDEQGIRLSGWRRHRYLRRRKHKGAAP